jgi:hypothetical protein
MRIVYTAVMLAVGIAAAKADTLETVTFSGTFESSLGVISAGDMFSGTMTWDLSTLGGGNPAIAEATALSIMMPSADGLSIPDLPDAQLPFAGATYSSGSFEVIQINDVSTVDDNYYVFYLGPSAGAVLLNDAGTADALTNFSFSGPTESTTPEPATSVSFAIGLGLMAASALRRLKVPKFG